MARMNPFTTGEMIAFNSDNYVGISTTRLEEIGFDRGIREILARLVTDRDAALARLKREGEYIAHLEAQVVGWTRDDMAVSAAQAVATPRTAAAGSSLTPNVRKRLSDIAERQGWVAQSVLAAVESLPKGDQYAATGAIYNWDRGVAMGPKQIELWNDHIAGAIEVI